MCLVLLIGKTTAYLKHIHIIVMTITCICRQVEALVDDALYRLPAKIDILGCAPRINKTACPCTGKCPTANVPCDFVATNSLYGSSNLLVALFHIKVKSLGIVIGVGTAIVNLDEVEIQFFGIEEEVHILGIVSIKTYTDSNFILWLSPIRSTGITAGIGIYTRFQTLAMDIIHKATQAVREAFGVNKQIAFGIAATEKAIIDIYVVISTILETKFHHCIGLSLDY